MLKELKIPDCDVQRGISIVVTVYMRLIASNSGVRTV